MLQEGGLLCVRLRIALKHPSFTLSVHLIISSHLILRLWLKGTIILVFLLGLTWLFGLLFVNAQTIAFAYIFTILNTLQGMFIFVFHCLLNEKVVILKFSIISRLSVDLRVFAILHVCP